MSAPAELVVGSILAGRDTIIAMPEPAPIARSEPRTAGGVEDVPDVAEPVPMVGRGTAADAGVADAAQKRPITEARQGFETRRERPQSQEPSDNQLAHGPTQTSHRSQCLPDQSMKTDPVSSARPAVLPDASSAEQRKRLRSSTSEAQVSSPPPASATHRSGKAF